MIPATQKKLREAKFFFAHLEQQARIPVWKATVEHAEFYFNALVSACRSVTFALQSESKVTYDAWYPNWLAARSTAEKLTLKRFNDERVKIVKRTGAKLTSRNILTPYDEVFPPTGDESPAYIMARIRHPRSAATVGTLELICRFSDGAEAPAIDAAREYIELLDVLIADFCQYYRGAI